MLVIDSANEYLTGLERNEDRTSEMKKYHRPATQLMMPNPVVIKFKASAKSLPGSLRKIPPKR
jgi:hypothetical protein